MSVFPPPAEKPALYERPLGAIPRKQRLWLHVLLLVLTILTATLAGTYHWQDESNAVPLLEEIPRNPMGALSGWPYAACLLLVLGSHEMGHYFACRHYRIPATLPFFLPAPPPFFLGTFGAVIRIRGAIPSRKALFDVAAAGPIAGFLVALPVLVAGILNAAPAPADVSGGGMELGSPLVSAWIESWVHGGAAIRVNSLLGAGWVGMLVTSLNLIPVGQLDGGHAAYALSRRLHRFLSLGTILGLFGLVAYQVFSASAAPVYVVWLLVALLMRDRHPRLLDESTPLGMGRKLVAVVLLLLFLVTFIPVPVRFVGL